jgi:cytochrome c biogenesis protein CcdA
MRQRKRLKEDFFDLIFLFILLIILYVLGVISDFINENWIKIVISAGLLVLLFVIYGLFKALKNIKTKEDIKSVQLKEKDVFLMD